MISIRSDAALAPVTRNARGAVAALLASASLLAFAGHAQAAAAATEATAVDELVVTGSRVQAPGLVSPTPVTSLSAGELATRSPVNIAEALDRLPQFTNSFGNVQSQTFSAASTQTVQGNFLNLRGLGVNRGLVLLDGIRLPPTDLSGGVDLNTLPQMLVKRVDVVTGGASAAYGSDAVVGVVNFVLDKDFTGLKGVIQGGVASRGDDKSYKVGAAYGTGFAGGAGHLLLTGEHYASDGLRMYDRARAADNYLLTGAGTVAAPFIPAVNSRFSTQAFGGLITSGPLAGNYFLPNGSITKFNHGTPTGIASVESGGDGAYYGNGTLNSPLKTDQLFARASYEFSPALSVHGQVSFGESHNFVDVAYPSLTSAQLTIFADNAYLTPAVRTALGTTPSFSLGTVRRDLLFNSEHVLNDAINAIVGAEGKFGQTWGWDVNYVYGFSEQRQKSDEIKFQNLYSALDSVRDASGNIVCRVAITNPGLYPGCAPLNLFGEGNVSAAAQAYIRQPSQNQTDNELNSAQLNFHGDLFATWAGPIAVAFGGELRRQSLEQTSNANPAIPTVFTGIRGVPANTLSFIRLNAGVASGHVTVKEGYAEAVVPLARDLPWAKSLDLNAAGRVTDYSTSGTAETWKLGLSYEPFGDLRFRGTVSRDLAAPTLAQLYAGPRATLSAAGQIDPHTNSAGQYQIITRGNPDLVPEVGKTYTVGFVYQPSWLPGFSGSIDAYSVKITNAIVTPGYIAVNNQCDTDGGTGQACALVNRPLPYSNTTAANYPISVSAAPLNIASLTRKGFDFEASYHAPVSRVVASWPGEVTVRAFASYSPTFNRRANSTAAVEHDAGATDTNLYGYPKLTGSFEIGYENGPLAVTVNERMTGSYRLDRQVVVKGKVVMPNDGYTDVTVRYSFGEARQYEGFVTVQNLFDRTPPFLPTTNNAGLAYPTFKTNYDVIGTYATVGMRFHY